MALKPSFKPSFPFRWVLPSVQLLVCFALLWPVRQFLFLGVMQSIHSYSNMTSKSDAFPDSEGVYVVPPATPEQQRFGDSEARFYEIRKTAPLALNFPVLIAQLPYILVSPTKREWVPKGMFPDIWRALSWPIAGMFFWWYLGRSFEALYAARQSVAHPRINWAETTFALILCGIGIVTLIGIVTSTPDDRRDIQFMALVAGGLLWGIMATATVVAGFLQWRLAKRHHSSQSTSDPTSAISADQPEAQ